MSGIFIVECYDEKGRLETKTEFSSFEEAYIYSMRSAANSSKTRYTYKIVDKK